MKNFISELQAKWIAAELIGTLLLTLTVGVVMIGGELYVRMYAALFGPLLIGLCVAVLVYVFGATTGGHFNPAVTISLWAARKVSVEQLIVYVISQLVGAYLGMRLVKALLGTLPNFVPANTSAAMLGELIGAFVLVMTISAVVAGRVSQGASGVVIGLALAIGINIALIASGGVLNPAIAISLGANSITYLLMPIVGALGGAGLVFWLTAPEGNSRFFSK